MDDDRWDDRDRGISALIEAAAGPRTALDVVALQGAARRRRQRQRRAVGAIAAVTVLVAGMAAVAVLSGRDSSVHVAVDGDEESAETPRVPAGPACLELAPPPAVRPATDDEREAVTEAILERRLAGAGIEDCASSEVIDALASGAGSGCPDLARCSNLVSAEVESGLVRITLEDGRVHEETYQAEWVGTGPTVRLLATEVRFYATHVRWTDPPATPEEAVERYLAALANRDFDLAALYMESTGREGPTGRDPNDPIVLQELASLAPEADLPELLELFCQRERLCHPLHTVLAVDQDPQSTVTTIVTVQLDDGSGQPLSVGGTDRFVLQVGGFEGIFSVGLPQVSA